MLALKETAMNTTRRGALRLLATAPAAAALASETARAGTSAASVNAPIYLRRPPEHADDARRLSFLRRACGERFSGVYFAYGRYQREALCQIDWRLRDVARTECAAMDPKLLDLLATIQAACGEQELIVTSGYRTEQTNRALRSKGAAKRSFHLKGQAVDFYCPGLSVKRLARLASREQVGGVGIYERRGFIHVDTGAPRYWRG